MSSIRKWPVNRIYYFVLGSFPYLATPLNLRALRWMRDSFRFWPVFASFSVDSCHQRTTGTRSWVVLRPRKWTVNGWRRKRVASSRVSIDHLCMPKTTVTSVRKSELCVLCVRFRDEMLIWKWRKCEFEKCVKKVKYSWRVSLSSSDAHSEEPSTRP